MKKLILFLLLISTALPQSSSWLLLGMFDKSYDGTYEVPSNKVMVVGTQSTHETDVLRAFIKGYQSTGGVWTGDTLTFTSTGDIQDAFDYAIANGYSTVIRSYTSAAADTSKALLNYPEVQYFATISNTKVQAFDTHISLPALIMPGTDSLGTGNVTAWNIEFLAPDSITGVGNRVSSYSNSYLAGQLCYIAHTLNVSYWIARYLARQTGTTYSVKNGYGSVNIAECLAAYNSEINYDLLDPYKYLPNTPTVSLAKYGNTGVTVTLTSSTGDDSTRLYKSTDGGSNYSWIKSLALNQNYVDTPLAYGTYYYKARNIKRMSLGATSNIASIYSGIDTIPTAFAFHDTTGCELTTEYISDSIVVSGLDSASIYAGGASYRKGKYGSWVTAYGMVHSADTIWVKNTSSSENSTAVNTVLTIGGVSDTYTITTKAGAPPSANNTIVFSSNPMSETALNVILAPTVSTNYNLDGNTVTFSNVSYVVNGGAFSGITTITSIALSCTTASDNAFEYMTALTTASFPIATTIGTEAFAGSTALTTISLPSCTNLGGTTDYDAVFVGMEAQVITLTVPSALMSCFGGDPDVDISDLQANNSVTIINP